MKWKKLGQIFNFENSPFKQRFISHSQSPQAVVFDDFVRIYFSTRKKDTESTFISYPQYVDFSKDFSQIIDYSRDDIMPLGKLGCFDEHGIFPLSPFRFEDKFYAYTTGWTRRISVSADAGIGLAVSKDGGKSFIRLGHGPILSSSLYEPFLVGDGFVSKFDNKFYMFYIFGQKWSEATKENKPDRVYKIAYATSDDAINWKKANRCIIEDKVGENECQALPTVIKIGSRYHMYFCYRYQFGFRENSEYAYRLGYAYSDDLINWIRDDKNSGITTTEGDWDSDMMCYPNIFEIDNQVYLLYNGNEFGKYGFGLAKLEGI